MQNIIISPIHKTYFSGRQWAGINVNVIKDHLKSIANVNVEIIEFSSVLNNLDLLKQNSYWFFSSSSDKDYNKYISEIVFYVNSVRPDITLSPNYDMLLALENKGYQELLKKRLGLEQLKGHYLGDITDLDQSVFTNYPYVLKQLAGAVSAGVSLVNNYAELSEKLKENGFNANKRKLKHALTKRKLKRLSFVKADPNILKNYDLHSAFRKPFILQEMIKGLDHDYKVLVFGSKYYVLKRYVRDNDFRASGSGKFVYEKPSDELLMFAKYVFNTFDVPLISLDIAEKEGKFYLIEFQGTAFGPVTLEKSKGYYRQAQNSGEAKWEYVEETPNLQKTYAEAFWEFIIKKEQLKVNSNR